MASFEEECSEQIFWLGVIHNLRRQNKQTTNFKINEGFETAIIYCDGLTFNADELTRV